MSEEVWFTDREFRAAAQTAKRVASIGRGFVEPDDVEAHLRLWMWENRDRIKEWRDEGKPAAYLRGALYKRALDYLSKERRLRTGAGENDLQFYTPPLIKELLADVFDREGWVPAADPSAARSPHRPSEGSHRLASLTDVAQAIGTLPPADQACLRDVYADGGLPWPVVASLWETSESGARKRVDRIVERLMDKLGGPPPWWPAQRDVRSNARAQAEVRE